MSKPERFNVSRRDFLKTAGVGSLATAVTAAGETDAAAQPGPRIVGPGEVPVTLMVKLPVAFTTSTLPPCPEILTSPLVSEILASPRRISMLTSPLVPRISMSPLEPSMVTGAAISEMLVSPLSLRTVI